MQPLNQQQTISALIAIARAARRVYVNEETRMVGDGSGRREHVIADNKAFDELRSALRSLDALPYGEGDFISIAEARLRTFDHPNTVSWAGNFLANKAHAAARDSGWWLDTETGEDVRTWPKKFLDLWISAKLMLIVTETAEAMEGHRKNLPDDKLPHRTMLEVELADAYIRIGDLAAGLGLDLGGAVEEKMAYNAQRADHKIENRLAAGGKSI